MRGRRILAVAAAACSLATVGLAGPTAAVAAPAVAAAGTPPMCSIASPEGIDGAQLMNNQLVNGTWAYATGVACTSNLADIALYEELDFNGVNVDSKFLGFTGVPRSLDAIISTYHCNQCNGNWLFKWGQIMKAPSGFFFTSPSAGCVDVQAGLYQLCVQTKAVTL